MMRTSLGSSHLLALLLFLAGALVVAGVTLWSTAAALVTAGVLLAGWALLVLVEVGS